MAAVGTRLIAWAGGEDEFCLAKVGSLLALEEACGAGIGAIFQRLHLGTYGIQDVRETIRLALMGAGKPPDKALAAVKLHVDGNENGLAPSVLLAKEIIAAVLIGVPSDPVGKKTAEGAEKPGQVSSATTAAFAAQPSTASPQA